jgi:hypothetical protein
MSLYSQIFSRRGGIKLILMELFELREALRLAVSRSDGNCPSLSRPQVSCCCCGYGRGVGNRGANKDDDGGFDSTCIGCPSHRKPVLSTDPSAMRNSPNKSPRKESRNGHDIVLAPGESKDSAENQLQIKSGETSSAGRRCHANGGEHIITGRFVKSLSYSSVFGQSSAARVELGNASITVKPNEGQPRGSTWIGRKAAKGTTGSTASATSSRPTQIKSQAGASHPRDMQGPGDAARASTQASKTAGLGGSPGLSQTLPTAQASNQCSTLSLEDSSQLPALLPLARLHAAARRRLAREDRRKQLLMRAGLVSPALEGERAFPIMANELVFQNDVSKKMFSDLAQHTPPQKPVSLPTVSKISLRLHFVKKGPDNVSAGDKSGSPQ